MNVLRRRLSLNIARVRGPLSHCSRIFYEPETTRLSLFDTRIALISSYNTTSYRKISGTSRIMASSQDSSKWTAPVVRKEFLSFFEKNAHSVGKWRGNCFGEGGGYIRISATVFPYGWGIMSSATSISFAIVQAVFKSFIANKIQCHRPPWSLTMTPLSSSRMLV